MAQDENCPNNRFWQGKRFYINPLRTKTSRVMAIVQVVLIATCEPSLRKSS